MKKAAGQLSVDLNSDLAVTSPESKKRTRRKRKSRSHEEEWRLRYMDRRRNLARGKNRRRGEWVRRTGRVLRTWLRRRSRAPATVTRYSADRGWSVINWTGRPTYPLNSKSHPFAAATTIAAVLPSSSSSEFSLIEKTASRTIPTHDVSLFLLHLLLLAIAVAAAVGTFTWSHLAYLALSRPRGTFSIASTVRGSSVTGAERDESKPDDVRPSEMRSSPFRRDSRRIARTEPLLDLVGSVREMNILQAWLEPTTFAVVI